MWDRNHGIHQRRASDAPIVRPAPIERDPAIELALRNDELEAVFQPIFDLASGRLAGAEALARATSIGNAEALFRRATAVGLAERLSRHVQRAALRQAASWAGALEGLSVSINLLPEDLARESYDRWLLAEIEAAGIDPRRVTVEITEHSLIGDVPAAVARLERLRSAGLRVALDDFGTGFASMANLAVLPLDYLKLDRSLIVGMERGEKDRILVRNILRLAGELSLETVVEGVESAGQLSLLRTWGCGLYQGFVRARPMTAAQLTAFALRQL